MAATSAGAFLRSMARAIRSTRRALRRGDHREPRRSASAASRGLYLLVRLAVTAEGDLNDPFVGAADDSQLDAAAACGPERIEQVVGCANWLTGGRHDQVALGEARAGGRSVLHYLADEQAVGVGQADGPAEPP